MGWISVEDMLPDEHVNVIVFIKTAPQDDCWRMAVMYRYQHWCWRGHCSQIDDGGDSFDCIDERVTHWRPLPELPKS